MAIALAWAATAMTITALGHVADSDALTSVGAFLLAVSTAIVW